MENNNVYIFITAGEYELLCTNGFSDLISNFSSEYTQADDPNGEYSDLYGCHYADGADIDMAETAWLQGLGIRFVSVSFRDSCQPGHFA